MKYFLYKLAHLDREGEAAVLPGIQGRMVEFSPLSLRWLFPLLKVGGTEYAKSIVMVAWAALAGVARITEFRVYAYVTCDRRVLHFSVVSPTAMHLPWLNEEEAGTEIGSCLTVSSARGMKIYPYILQQIAGKKEHALPLYMIVDDINTASQAGMMRAGFELVQPLRRLHGSTRPPRYVNLETS